MTAATRLVLAQANAPAAPLRALSGAADARRSHPHGGELNAAVTRALVGIQNEYVGRGPRTASAFYHGVPTTNLRGTTLNRVTEFRLVTGAVIAGVPWDSSGCPWAAQIAAVLSVLRGLGEVSRPGSTRASWPSATDCFPRS
jgi:hypothetical protein